MDDIVLTSALRSQGLNADDLARLIRRAELSRVRRGAYTVGSPGDLTVKQIHRRMVLATAPQLQEGSVISHGSAAVLHGIPIWADAIKQVHISRSRSGGGRRRSIVQVHGAPLRAEEVVVQNGIPVTSLPRTVLDLARTLPMEQAVAAGDAALALGLNPAALELGLLAMERWPGIRQARRTCAFLDARSESVGESVSRVRLHTDGLPCPDLQQEVLGPDGQVLARVDFLWKEQRTVGEFDGKIKYGRLLKPGQTAAEVIYAEKLREDLLRDFGYQVVRWIWIDLYKPGVIRNRVLRAFARSAV